ncbi:MAG TPA: hypothetical protein PK784_05730 [Tenuifilaceae bacterium]|nr:hypothetical protein [Tenuifilaceae bacterium]
MKKVMTVFATMMFVSFIMLGCSNNSIEQDAKKVAELYCKAQKLALKATQGDISVMEEAAKLTEEADALSKEMEGKYTSDSDAEKFAVTLEKEMGKCK